MPRKPKANSNLYRTFAGLAYKKHTGVIKEGLHESGFVLDQQLSDQEHMMLYNPSTKMVSEEQMSEMLAEYRRT